MIDAPKRAATTVLGGGRRPAGRLRPRAQRPPAATQAPPAKPAAAPTTPPRPLRPASGRARNARRPAQACRGAGGQPKSGGTLRLGMVGDVSTVDGHNTTPNQFDTTWSVFDRLISYDSTLQPQPSWPRAGI